MLLIESHNINTHQILSIHKNEQYKLYRYTSIICLKWLWLTEFAVGYLKYTEIWNEIWKYENIVTLFIVNSQKIEL